MMENLEDIAILHMGKLKAKNWEDIQQFIKEDDIGLEDSLVRHLDKCNIEVFERRHNIAACEDGYHMALRGRHLIEHEFYMEDDKKEE